MPDERRIVRCAIYTRKSSEEGLEQDFNSLDAQFEACGAYVASQRHEGWKLISTRYDDGGFSGGTLERPGLKRLLADIEGGRVDMVVVYKIDRLTRSLLDFGKLVELLDKANCSFVSVTQSFNTSTSMGRLTLNMLLSFAQFEREVTGERIRDKIAASKKKGLWMGGVPPLGYQCSNRQLVIDQSEAKTVRRIYALYREHHCLVRTKVEAHGLGLRSRASQRHPQGPAFTRGGIYWLLTNPIYAGRIRHKKQTYQGQHQPLIDPANWDALQSELAARPGGRRRGKRNAAHASLLAGKLVDDNGERLTPSHSATSSGRRRYYVSKSLLEGGAGSSGGWRLPAKHLEETVATVIKDHLTLDSASFRFISHTSDADKIRRLHHRLKGIASELDEKGAAGLVQKARVSQGRIEIELDPKALADSLGCQPDEFEGALLRCTGTFQMRRRGVEMRLLLGHDPMLADPALIRFVARGHAWWRDVTSGLSISDLARRDNVSTRLISMHLPSAFLAPDIVELVLAGRQPVGLTVQVLRTQVLPSDWNEQRAVFGLPATANLFPAG